MTCEEVRWYFEDHLRDAEGRADRGTVAEHVSTCADCVRYVEEQRALGFNLRLVRESAPRVPESLDAAVVARYQRYLSQREASSPERGRPLLSSAVWGWSAVATAVLALAGLWFFSASHKVASPQASTPYPAASIPVAPAGTATSAAPATATAEHRHTAASKTYRPKAAERAAVMPAREARALPEGFRSLMYCDALSCPGDMDVIRVQMPAYTMSRQVPGLVQTSGSVTADVLVGPDGIARGIRFDEIEF